MASRLYGDVPFAMVPEWILFHPRLDDRAVRLWGILARYSRGTSVPTPSRKTLAAELSTVRTCSTDSVDRAKRLLLDAGALEVRHRRTADGEPTSNEYVLLHEPPCCGTGCGRDRCAEWNVAPSGEVRTGAQGGRTGAATQPHGRGDPGRTDAAQVEREGSEREETPPVGVGADGADPVELGEVARRLVAGHFDRCTAERRPKPVLRRERGGNVFMALAKIVETLLDAGYDEDAVADALWNTTGGHTLQGLGVYLTKHHRPEPVLDVERQTTGRRAEPAEWENAAATAARLYAGEAEAVEFLRCYLDTPAEVDKATVRWRETVDAGSD